MTLSTFAQFEAEAKSLGFDEVLERLWKPDQVVGTHAHPYAVSALVAAGEMWLGCEGRIRHLQAGDRFTLEPGTPHDERYGPQGATFWAARRNPAD